MMSTIRATRSGSARPAVPAIPHTVPYPLLAPVDDAVPAPATPDPPDRGTREQTTEQRPVVTVEVMYLGANVAERVEEPTNLPRAVDPGERTVGAVRVRTEPLFRGREIRGEKQLAMALQLGRIDAQHPRHQRDREGRIEQIPGHLAQEHDLEAVVDRAPVVDHHAERAAGAQ